MKPLLSVIIPTYNRVDVLKETFHMLMKERSNEIEFIVLDNASEDGTEEYIKSFVKTDSRIRYLKNHVNIGANRSIYRGYLESKSNWICFMPDDDLIEKGFLTELIRVIDKNQNCGVIINLNNQNDFLNQTSSKRVKSGIEALKSSFGLSGVITGLTLNKKLIEQEYWTLDNSIYPQISLAMNLSLNNDLFIHSPKNKISIGKTDSIEVIIKNRSTDFGVIERLDTLIDVSKKIKKSQQSNIKNNLSAGLFAWAINISKLMYANNEKNTLKYIKSLLKHKFIKSSMSFHGILIFKFILNKKINLRFKISVGFKILKSISLSIFNKNLYQSSYYILCNFKRLKMKINT